MQIEHLDNHTARLTVEVEQPRLEAAMQRSAKRIASKVNIPGFRKGKAPFSVILQWVGQQAVMDDALEELGNEVYRNALTEANIEPYAMGSLEEVRREPTLTLVFSLPKAPETQLGEYREIRLPYTAPEVSEEDVTRALDSIRDQKAVTEGVERPAEMGDILVANLHGEMTHDHAAPEEHEHAEGEEHAPEEHADEEHTHAPEEFINRTVNLLLTTENERDFLPGFSAHMIGVTAGEERQVTLSYPEDYAEKMYAGHTYKVTAKVEAVRSRTVPELTDDFAKEVSEGAAQTVDEMRSQVRTDLEDTAKREAEDKYVDQIFEQVVQGSIFKYPEVMIEEFTDDIIEELANNLKERGLSLDQLKMIEQKTDEQLRADYRNVAIGRIKRSLTLRGLSAAEGLVVTIEEVNAHLDTLAASFSTDPKQVASFRQMLADDANVSGLAANMLMDRVKKRLMAIARGENPPIGPEVGSQLTMPVAESQISIGGPAPEPDLTTPAEPEAPQAPEAPEAPAGDPAE